MMDIHQMVKKDIKFESLRLEILQTLATLPIPNKSMLQDSKVLATIEKWSRNEDIEESQIDSDSNSPKVEEDYTKSECEVIIKSGDLGDGGKSLSNVKVDSDDKNDLGIDKKDLIESKDFIEDKKDFNKSDGEDINDSPMSFEEKENGKKKEEGFRDYKEEIVTLALKLLEEWTTLKEVFRIPKRERIEQMKEHEREADRKYKATWGTDNDALQARRVEDRYRVLQRYRHLETIINVDRLKKETKSESSK